MTGSQGSSGFGSNPEPEAAADLNSVIRFMAGQLNADGAAFATADGQAAAERVYAAWGLPLDPAALDRALTARSGGGAFERYASLQDSYDLDGSTETISKGLTAPVRSPKGVTGTLAMGYLDQRPTPTEATVNTLASYAEVVGLWLDDPDALVGLLRAAYEDALTGCLTHAALTQQLEHEIERSRRGRWPLSCLFIDLDGFKRVNGRHGHLAGNQVLVAVADTLRARLRSTDTIGRFGGDEFIVVLPDTATLQATMVADALCEAIAASTGELLGTPVEASVGVSELSAWMTAHDLLERADGALRGRRDHGAGTDRRPLA